MYMHEGLPVMGRLLGHIGLPVVRHDAYIMCEWSTCHVKSLSVMRHDCNHDSHVLQ